MQRALVRQIRRSKKFASWGSRTRESFREKPTPTDTKGYTSHERHPILEKHFTPSELGTAWGLSTETIRKIFEKEPDVLIVGTNGTRSKRRYRTFRIPEHVAARVHNRLSS
jgi:hypothetical protein